MPRGGRICSSRTLRSGQAAKQPEREGRTVSDSKSDKMPGLIQETPFRTFTVRELHPTFGAEIEGVDWDKVTDEGLREIIAAMAKVRDPCPPPSGV